MKTTWELQTMLQQKSKMSVLPWVICALAALFYCYEYFLRISPSVFTDDLMNTYGLGGAALGNLVAFYYYAYTPMQLPVGLLMDRYGPRALLTLASLLCAIGSFLFAATQIVLIAQMGRFLVGFGSSFAFVGVLKLASIWLKRENFGFVVGLATTLGMVGAMVGQNALARLVKTFGWQQVTYASAVFGVVLALILWGMIRNGDTREVIVSKPVFFSRIFKDLFVALQNRQIWLAGIVGGLLYIPTSVFAELWGVPYLEQAQGFSVSDAAGAISMIFLGWAIGGPLIGAISDRLRRRKLPIILGSFVAAGLMTLFLFTDHMSQTMICITLLIFGIFSSAENITFAIARESCSDSIAGTAVAVNNFLVMLGGMLLQPLVGKMLDVKWNGVMENGHRVFTNADYQHALLVLPVGLLLAGIMTFFIRETYAKAAI